MKKQLLALIILSNLVLLFTNNATAADRFWVEGSGNWDNSQHWSSKSGGKGGMSIPTENDNVIFDENSFTVSNQHVFVSATSVCKNFSWKQGTPYPFFEGQSNLNIHGSFELNQEVNFLFSGDIFFKSESKGNTINTKDILLNSNVFFIGKKGEWKLEGNFFNQKSIYFETGYFSSNNNFIKAKTVQIKGKKANVDFGKSKIILEQIPIGFNAKSVNVKFPPDFIYTQKNQTHNNGANSLLQVDSIKYTIISPSCNNSSEGPATNGSINITNVYGACGNLGFEWTGGTLGAGIAYGNPLTNIGPGNYLVLITDSCDMSQFPAFITVNAPNPLAVNFAKKVPTCFGYCNGWINVTPLSGAGTAPYTYLWLDGQTQKLDTALCVTPSTSVTVTDFNGCSKTFPTSLVQPQLLTPNITPTNISCFGFCNGQALANPLGGTGTINGQPATASPGGYDYLWGGSQTTPGISNLCPGSYTVTVTDDSLCVGIQSITITEPDPLVLNPLSSNVTCGGACDGEASVSPIGGTSPYNFAWTATVPGVFSGSALTSLCPGTYTVIVSDNNACNDTVVFVITEPAPLLLSINGTNVICNGNCDGSASGTPTGGTGPFNMVWTNSSNIVLSNTTGLNSSINNLCPDTYSLSVTDAQGCTVSGSIDIIEPSILIANASSTDISCFGSCDGTANVNISGGTPGYTSIWSNAVSGSPITALCEGQFSVIVTDQNNCQVFDTVFVNEPALLTVFVNDDDVSCSGVCDGQLTANVSGGTGTYFYNWSNSQTTQTASSLCINTYSVIVSDNNGCTASASAEVINPTTIVPNVTVNNITCFGLCNGTATANPSGGTGPYSFLWNMIPNQIGQTAINLCAGVAYTVTVTDVFGCFQQQTVTLTQPPVFNSTAALVQVDCFGNCTGSITLSLSGATPPYNVSWNTNPVQSGNQAINLCMGSYTATITDNLGCVYMHTENISEPVIMQASATFTNVNCFGICDGTATANATGGSGAYSYSWNTNPPQFTQSISNLCPGLYTVIISDANGCLDSTNVTITQPLVLNASVTNASASCNTVCDGQATVSVGGGTAPYSYLWNTPIPQTTPTAIFLCVGTHSVTVTDSKGCSIVLQVQISPLVNITINSTGTGISCFGACDAQATATGFGGLNPYTYSWNTPIVQTTQTATGICAGPVTVTVTDANGCSHSADTVFINPPVLTLNFSNVVDAICGSTCNGSAFANAAGGSGTLAYEWNSTPIQATASANNLCSGYQVVTITDQNACSIVDSVFIDAPMLIDPAPNITNATCGNTDGEILLNTSGGTPSYSYLWSNGQTGNPATNLAAAVYWVQITDNVSCIDTFFIIVNSVSGPQITSSTTPASCNGVCDGTASVVANSGLAPYTYSWFSGPTTELVSNLCAGVQFVTVTDANLCVTSVSDTVNQPNQIVGNPIVTNVSCNGFCNGSVFLSPSGGNGGPYTFLWSNGSTNPFRSNLCPGNYPVSITDINGCSVNLTINVGAATMINPNPLSTNINCNGSCNGLANVNPSGGQAPYSFSWFPTGPNGPSNTGLCPGSYQVTITDANGCNVNQIFTITEPAGLAGNISKTDLNCFENCNGTASVTATGGSGIYTYFWLSTGQTTSSIANLCKGNYSVSICDSLSPGCCITLNINITEPDLLTLNATGTDLLCNSVCSGTLNAVASGGTGPYNYSWLPLGLSGSAQSGICAGNYTVTVSDANGCASNASVVIAQPSAILLNQSSTNASCFGICDGTASVSPIGGTGSYTYLWTPDGQSTSSIAGLCSDSYNVQVTDINGCVATQSFNITEPLEITATSTSNIATCGICDGSATVFPVGGVGGPFTFLWDDPAQQTTATATNLCAGLYNVTITDASLCSILFSVAVSNNGGPLTSHVFTDALCFGACNGTATVTASGPNNPFSYNWTPGSNTSPSAINLCAGIHFVQVADTLGCITFETITIGEPEPVQGNPIINNVSCQGVCDGAILLNTSGGNGSYNYTWSGGLSNSASQSGLCIGTYTVQIEDGNNCIGNESILIQVPGPLQVSGTNTNVSCNGYMNGTATVNITGGTSPYSVTWSTGPVVITSGIATVSGLAPGTYSAQVVDANGCNGAFSYTITEPSIITVNSTITQITCNGSCNGSISIVNSGGTGPYTINWSTGFSGNTLSNLCPGLYNVTVTDASGCSRVSSFNITQPNILTASAGGSNVSCYGACNGTGLITPTGGTAPYFYLWSPGGYTSENPSGLCAGNYSIIVTDANGCNYNTALTLTQPAAITDNFTVTSPPCNICNGEATVSPLGGSGAPYDISWSNSDIGNTAVNLCAGLYTVNITDNSGCMQNFTVPVSNENGPVVIATSNNASCNTNCDGSSTLSVSGGTPGYTYSWTSNPSTSENAIGLCAGTYYATVTDIVGCITINTVIISESTIIQANASSISADCGVCDGSAGVNPIGGVGPYSYIWSNNETSSSIAGLCAGLYSVLITDANGCSITENIAVTNSNGPTGASQTTTNVSCYGSLDGGVTIFPSGGTTPYYYSWTPGGYTSNTISNASAGVYNVQVMDANSCIMNVTVTINGPSEIIANPSFIEPDCGDTNGEITLTPTGGAAPYTYLWAIGGQSTPTITGLGAALYPVTITDAMSCSKNDTIALSNTNGPVLVISSSNTTCNGSCNGSASVAVSNGSGDYSIVWSNGIASNSISSLCPGNYIVTVTDNVLGCISFATATITQPASIIFGFSSTTGVSCESGCDGTAVVFPTGGILPYSYSWNFGSQITQTATGLCVGSNIVSVTDANGCTAGQTVVINTKPPILITASTTNANCGECDGSAVIDVSGGTGPYTYLWSNNNTTITSIDLCSGVYSVQVTDAIGCSESINVNISDNGGPTGENSNVTDVSCFGLSDGSAVVNPVGGVSPYSYLWIPGAQTTNTISAASAGNYSLEITDANGCKRVASVDILQPSQISVNSFITNSSCTVCNGSINLIVSGGAGGYTYNWTSGGQTTSSLTGLCAGLYNVIISDANGCSESLNIAVSNTNGPTASITSTAVNCFGVCDGSATVLASGGSGTYNYLWTPGAFNASTAINLCAGTYFVEVQDAVSGCITFMSTSLTNPNQLSLSSPNVINVSCGGICDGQATIIASGGVLPYSYNWGSGSNTNLCAGSYPVTVTDFNGCTASQNLTINEPVPIVINLTTIIDPTCSNVNNGSINVTITGGSTPYIFEWGGSSNSTLEDINDLFEGSYSLSVTDQMGCKKDTLIMLNPLLQVSALALSDTTYCVGRGPVFLTGRGGSTFTWYTLPDRIQVSKDSIFQVNPSAGVHQYLLAAEVGQCVAFDTVTVTVNASPEVNAGLDASIIAGTSLTIGGSPTSSPGNTYLWSPSESLDNALIANPSVTPANSAIYHITVTDQNGCVSNDSVLVSVIPKIIVTNGITPNGDGLNDTWIIDNIQFFPESIVEVYNRWGEMLFRSNPGYTNPWNGTYNGGGVPVGTYYYVINLHDDRFEPLTGPITIMR
ncbi:MAG: gliding motility-associated C-terminal domain-containing protein [Bacteroidetes bacterium]|nr:gliding motility-associated C-terminal domain-containing protein [Bacteroidota bacterium]HET6244436.1 gliding motility-associated C-terminal domain-containing protein [Bacteroidia bacterium]